MKGNRHELGRALDGEVEEVATPSRHRYHILTLNQSKVYQAYAVGGKRDRAQAGLRATTTFDQKRTPLSHRSGV